MVMLYNRVKYLVGLWEVWTSLFSHCPDTSPMFLTACLLLISQLCWFLLMDSTLSPAGQWSPDTVPWILSGHVWPLTSTEVEGHAGAHCVWHSVCGFSAREWVVREQLSECGLLNWQQESEVSQRTSTNWSYWVELSKIDVLYLIPSLFKKQ